MAVLADHVDPQHGQRYSALAIMLHWTIALAIAFQLAGGLWMVSADASATPWVFTAFQIHKTVGLTILALTLARIAWRLANPAPALPEGMTRWEAAAARVAHVGFYGLLLALPLTGWAMASVSPTGVPTLFLLLDALPFAHLPFGDLSLTERHALEAALKAAHENLSWAMVGLVVLHVGAALKHQLIARDNLLARMILSARTRPVATPRTGLAFLSLALAALFLAGGIGVGLLQRGETRPQAAAPAAVPASAGAWVIDAAQSAVTFTLTFSDAPVTGTIGAWTADILFDPQALDASRASVTLDMASVAIANPMLAPQAGGSDGFDVAGHPIAIFAAETFTALDDGRFLADGSLTLRGVTVAVPLVFSFAERDGVARVEGQATLDRLAFGIGAVGAADEAWLRHAVVVDVQLVATRP